VTAIRREIIRRVPLVQARIGLIGEFIAYKNKMQNWICTRTVYNVKLRIGGYVKGVFLNLASK
jgi:hypothetical protein